jgi:ribosome-binding protein aMBF1 (putative translation factor)
MAMGKYKTSQAMRETPLREMGEHCFSCDLMKIDTSDMEALADARAECQHCTKYGNRGMYKFDALYTANKARGKEFKPNKGKKPTVGKKHGDIIKALHGAGQSQRKIAEMLGLSPTTVNKYLQEAKDKT